MVDYEKKTPGVWIEAVDPTGGPIAGVGTSTAGMIGQVATPRSDGVRRTAVPITNWTGFTTAFGDLKSGLHLPFAVRGFFQNGGSLVHVVEITDPSDGKQVDAALDELSRVDVNLVCAPGLDAGVQTKVAEHCAGLRNRFAVLDGVQVDDPLAKDNALLKQRDGLRNPGEFAALYWPWVVVDDPTAAPDAAGQRTSVVPPSGHVAGVMARTDARVGVHKAPANEGLFGVRAISYAVNDAEHGELNSGDVNVLRSLTGSGPLVWGAHTLSTNEAWRFVNVRRLVSFVEESLRAGLRWAVYAPNNPALWKTLERSVTEFLDRIWRSGALFGRTAQDAYYVRIDEELNPPAERALGKVVIEVGIAPTRPAEYVVVRLGFWDGASSAA